MDHLDISNTVDSTGALRIAGAATTDVSFCSVFLNLAREKAIEKIAYKNFLPCSSYLGVRLKVYLSSQKLKAVFFYILGKSEFLNV
jgi:hypothetical protein